MRSSIHTVTFRGTLDGKPEDSRMMFYPYTRVVSIDFGNCVDTSAVRNMGYMFTLCRSITMFAVSSFDTASVTTMLSLFCGCESLETLDLTFFDTGNVREMTAMFSSCYALRDVTVTDRFVINPDTKTRDMFYQSPFQSVDDFTLRR